MRLLFIAAPMLLMMKSFTNPPSIGVIRSLYFTAASDEKKCREMLNLLNEINNNSTPLLLGYKGSATMMMAKHVANPFTKLSWFNRGKSLLEAAITRDSTDIELRYLRFAIQKNVPPFLGYRSKLASDKRFLEHNRNRVTDKELQNMIALVLSN